MVFSSAVFLWGFLPLVLLFYWFARKTKKIRNYVLLFFSLLFYAWGEPKFVLVMVLSVVVNWAGALLLRGDSKRSRLVFILAVTVNVGLLFVCKYLNFTIENINRLFGRIVLPQTSVALPIGISFFTFQGLSYLIDVYRGEAEPQRNLLNVALYISLFPQLIAGPIVRYRVISEELSERETTTEDLAAGISRFMIGLGKKAVLANTLAILADGFFARTATPGLTWIAAWIGALSYTFQIYFDFSGYSDMAIGLGRMFGFHFEENFNYPYISRSVSEFWRRWHISLGSWFRDYVYIPLGGSRGGKGKTCRNLLVVWLLTGAWHGANWTFILWGVLHCVMIMGERAFPRLREKIPAAVQYLATALVIVAGWVLFRADTVQDGFRYLGSMFSFRPMTSIDVFELAKYLPMLAAAFLFAMPVVPWLRKRAGKNTKAMNAFESFRLLGITVVAILAVSCVISSTYNPFIYFNF